MYNLSQMAYRVYSGTCNFCNQTFAKSAIGRHLQTCGEIKGMHLFLGSPYLSEYWLHTELSLKVISEQKVKPSGKPIKILARNNQPQFECANCKKEATQICAMCFCEEGKEIFLCDVCAEKHVCEGDGEAFLPIVSSPRMGVCGYTGPL